MMGSVEFMVNDVGTQLGNYRLQRVLGRGGFADVYLGEHIYLRTSAAIKVLRTQLSDDALTQFLTEARTIARLAHSHIVSVLDFGIEREIPFLVMSYAPHGTVRERHPVGSVLPVGTVIAYAKQMAEALQYAHERKVIHRDVKPENMLLGEDERLMLSDFGIALTTQNTAGMVLKPSQDDKVVGTTTYMSPEQFTGTPSLLSDQYALAVVVYEWLSGAPPFVGSDMDIVKQHMYTAPPPLRAKAPHLSEAFEQVVLRALSKEQQDRFPRVMEFTQALEDASGRVACVNSRHSAMGHCVYPALSPIPVRFLPFLLRRLRIFKVDHNFWLNHSFPLNRNNPRLCFLLHPLNNLLHHYNRSFRWVIRR
jgi:serine/threonine protein kinase